MKDVSDEIQTLSLSPDIVRNVWYEADDYIFPFVDRIVYLEICQEIRSQLMTEIRAGKV